ncbi:hypothetical protein D3C73_1380860 [compost metagenome]
MGTQVHVPVDFQNLAAEPVNRVTVVILIFIDQHRYTGELLFRVNLEGCIYRVVP